MLASIFALILAVSGPLLALGGVNGTVTGRVVASDGKAVAGAAIALTSPSGTVHATSSKDGRFSILGVPAATYVLHVDKPGFYELQRGDIEVDGDAETTLGDVKIAPAGASDTGGTPVPSPAAN